MSEQNLKSGVLSTQVITSTFVAPKPGMKDAGAADAALLQSPGDPELWLKKGHSLAKEMKFREAISAYSLGLSYDPFHALLLRFRGHRYLSVRFFQQGAADLELSSRLNDRNWDTWYHLGLAYYLLGDYARAEAAYEVCLPLTPATKDPTLWPAITAWLWRTKIKLNKEEEAKNLLLEVDPAFHAGENQFYQNCVCVYAGFNQPGSLKEAADGISVATQGYGLCMYYEAIGDQKMAEETRQWVLDNGYWAAFGYLAAEADAGRGKA
jgi:tetratricopeptide (TPR) repeat protein